MKHAVLLLLLIVSGATAQVGTWHTYTDMKQVRDVVTATDGYWAATSGGVFHLLPDGSFARYTNVDGLSVIDYAAIAVDEKGRVIAGSTSGMINIYVPDVGWYEVSDIARAEAIPARGITVIDTALPNVSSMGTGWSSATEQCIRTEWAGALNAAGVPFDAMAISEGSVVDGLLDAARNLNADLLVMGMQGTGWISGVRLGGKALQVVHRATVAVVIVPPDEDVNPV